MKVHRIKEQLEVYKSRLNKQRDSYIMYPFEALANYQKNWDIEALDFAKMYDKSLKSNISNILWSGDQYHPKQLMLRFIEIDKEFVRLMFRDLYNEDKDLALRINRFIYYCDEMLETLKTKDHKVSTHYHGDMRMVTTYLSFQFPELYTSYDFKMFKNLMMRLESQKIPVVDEVVRFQTLMKSLYHNFICKDPDLINNMKELSLDPKFYSGPTTMWVHHFAKSIGASRR